jgi:hypothetical protein
MPVKELRLLAFMALAATPAFAQEQPRGLIGATDLKSIVLSPAPLGPPARFEPPAAVAQAPTVQSVAETEMKVERKAPQKPQKKTASTRSRQKATVAAKKPRTNPLNSFARDVQRQTWPCIGGGICGWTQPR